MPHDTPTVSAEKIRESDVGEDRLVGVIVEVGRGVRVGLGVRVGIGGFVGVGVGGWICVGVISTSAG